MGSSASSELAGMLSGTTAIQLLEDDSFIEDMQAQVADLPPSCRQNLRRLLERAGERRSNTISATAMKLRPLMDLPETQTAPLLELQLYCQQYQFNNIMMPYTSVADIGSWNQPITPLAVIYECTVLLEKKRIIDRIWWRFYTMFFFDLHYLLTNQKYVTANSMRILVMAIYGSYPETPHGSMIHNLKSWISKGHRYRTISNALGDSGCLIVLPETISDYLWEEALPLRGKIFEQAIAKLRRMGINRQAIEINASLAASNIEARLELFRWQSSNQSKMVGAASDDHIYQSQLSSNTISNDEYFWTDVMNRDSMRLEETNQLGAVFNEL